MRWAGVRERNCSADWSARRVWQLPDGPLSVVTLASDHALIVRACVISTEMKIAFVTRRVRPYRIKMLAAYGSLAASASFLCETEASRHLYAAWHVSQTGLFRAPALPSAR